MKKFISLFLAVLMIVSIVPVGTISASAATNHTQAEAVEWIKARGNENWWQDVDGAYGCQCVDLIKAYYQYLVGYSVSGNAKDYLQSSKLPSGWWMDSTPSAGAIIVWGGNTWTGQWTTGTNGHVGLVYSVSGSNVYTVETNTGSTNGQGDAAAAKFRTRVNCNAKYIHPDFSSTQAPSISYSSITPGEYYIENGNGMIMTTPYNNTSSGTLVNVWDFNAHPGYRVNITGSSDGYKLRFSNCADNIAINAYSDSPKNGTTVNIREYTNNSTQWWRFESVGNGYYAIRNAYNPSVCLTLNPDSGNHGNVNLQTYTGSIYQKWSLRPYSTGTVSYNANGGSGAPASQTKHYRENLTLSSTKPNRSGYTFVGWSTSVSATTATYVAGGTYSNESSVTLYAVWQKNPATVSSIAVQSKPTKTVYTVGETFSSSGLSLKVNMSDGTSKTVTSGFTVSSPDMATAGTKTVTVTYEGKTTTFTITVNNPPATVYSIAVQTMPSKTVYTVGETFSSSGIVVKVNMSDGTSKTVTSGFTVSAPNMSTAGTKTVTVTYEGKTTTFNITVNAPANPTSAKYKISGATATAGSTVEVYVSIENNPGIISLRNQVVYDTTALELIKVEDLKLLSGYTTPSPTVNSPYTLRWADSLATQNNKANGNFVKLTFKIKDDAKAGDYGISVSHIESRTATGEKVEFADCSAVITVIDYIIGDVDGNGEVDDWDAIVLNRYLAGWQTEANLVAADMDGDGELTDWDAIALERRLAGWDV